MTPSMAALDSLNEAVLKRYGKGEPFVPEENLTDAIEFSRALQGQLDKTVEAVKQVSAAAMSSPHDDMLVAELTTLHSVELERVALMVARAVARKDPSRIDGRYSEATQRLADVVRRFEGA